MNYWIFVANYWKLSDGQWVDSREIIRTRAGDKFWGLGERTPNRKALAKGAKNAKQGEEGERKEDQISVWLASYPLRCVSNLWVSGNSK